MKIRNERILSFTLAFVVAITAVNTFAINNEAEAAANEQVDMLDLSNVNVDVNVVKNGDSQLISNMTASTYTIDQVEYKNYCTYEGFTATASSELGAADRAIDGNTNSRWESEQGVDPQYLQIDFGNVYLLKDIAVFWETASAKEYTIEVSADGTNFEKLTAVTSDVEKRTDEIKLSQEISVRAVRIYCTTRTTIYGYSIYEIAFFGSEMQKEFVSVLSNLQVKDYYKYTGKYLIYFNEPAESSGYNVYLDESTVPLKKIDGSGASISAGELAGVSEGEHTLCVANIDANGNDSAKVKATFNLEGSAGNNTDIPQVYIYTTGTISEEYHDEDDVTISVIDRDGGIYEELSDNECNIKIRGNTTSTAPKKPWNIKLSSKESILGMDKGKKWCLLANSFDKSLMRNSLAYDFGLQIGVTYTCQSRYVEVYVNGVFNGNYLITEPVEAKKERVDIDAYDADSNDILLELGTRNEEGVDHFTTTVLNTTFDVNDPEKGDDLTDTEVDAKIERVKTYLNEFESVLRGQNYDEILKYIDEDTFVNFYIVNELFKNVDFNFSSTRFYIKDDKIYAGPLWDFDLSSGNCKSSYYTTYYVDGVSYKGYYCQSMNWYRELLKNESFYNKIKERYKELQYAIQNIYSLNSETNISVQYLLGVYGNSFERNFVSTNLLGAGWSLTNEDGYSYAAESGWTTWQQPVEFLRSWLENRNIWLCTEWGIDMQAAYEESKPVEPETTTPEQTTEEITTEEMTTEDITTDKVNVPESTTPSATTANPTTEVQTTGKDDSSKKSNVKVARVKIKKASKKKAARKVYISVKKLKNVTKYRIHISKNKKFSKKSILLRKTVKKATFNISSKKLKNRKKLYIRVRAIKVVNGKKYYGKWSKIVRIKIKK